MFNHCTEMDKEFYELSQEAYDILCEEPDFFDNLDDIEYDDYEFSGDFSYD